MWVRFDTKTPMDWLGFLPEIIKDDDARPAKEQITERYAHGGGYVSFGDGKYTLDTSDGTLTYPGEPPLKPLFGLFLPLSGEVVTVYDYAITAILKLVDKSFEVVRLD